MYYTTRAMILSLVLLSEWARQYWVLTEERGLVVASALGVMRLRSKLGPELTPYRLLTLNIVGRATDRIIGVEVLDTYRTLWRDPVRQGYAAWAQALVQHILKPGFKDLRIFHLLREYLECVNDVQLEGSELSCLRLAFAARLNQVLGHALFDEKKDVPMVKTVTQALSQERIEHVAQWLKPIARAVHERVEAWIAESLDRQELPSARFLRSFTLS